MPRNTHSILPDNGNWKRSIISQQLTGYINCGFFMNMRHTHATMKVNEIQLHTATWVGLALWVEGVRPTKNIDHVILFMWRGGAERPHLVLDSAGTASEERRTTEGRGRVLLGRARLCFWTQGSHPNRPCLLHCRGFFTHWTKRTEMKGKGVKGCCWTTKHTRILGLWRRIRSGARNKAWSLGAFV